MKTKFFLAAIAGMAASLIALSSASIRADEVKKVDIKRVAPTDSFLVVYAKHNPERDYQRQYLADALKTIQDERICERLMNIITSRVPQEKLDQARSKLQEVQTALQPINVQALLNADEIVVTEVMEAPINQVLFAARLNSKDAADCERGISQACDLITRWSEGAAKVETSHAKDATVTALTLPKQSPYQPAFARLGDIVLISTNVGLLNRSLEQLQNETAKSKFDDPRLKEALTHLPKPEDQLVFFDGQQLFQNLHGITAFIRGQAHNDEKATRVAHLLDRVFDEVAILDYEVTVGYTEPGQNRQVAFGKLADNIDNKILGRMIASAKPLDNWQTWVPKNATAFSLTAGVNLHEVYNGVVNLIQEEFPESKEGFDKWAEVQAQIGVNLDRDILQSFTGECVHITVPVKAADESVSLQSVSAMKCGNPDKIRELMSRAVEELNKIPAVQMQQLKLEDCTGLEGFQKLQAATLQMLGATPVIGFRDGWMFIATSQGAVEQLLAVRAGKAESIDSAATFQKLGLDPKGAIYSMGYYDVGASIRRAADMVDKVGAMAPMFLGMATANATPDEIKPVQEAVAIIPSIAKVIRKFDYFGHNLGVVRKGPEPGTYLRESVTEVRLPNAK